MSNSKTNKIFDNWTRLYYAVYYNMENEVIKFVNDKVDLNEGSSDHNWTPLHCAIYYDRVNIANILINAGANLTIKNDEGQTPLCFAVFYRKTDIIRMLLIAGADINEIDDWIMSALFYNEKHGVTYRHTDIVNMLIAYGPNNSSMTY